PHSLLSLLPPPPRSPLLPYTTLFRSPGGPAGPGLPGLHAAAVPRPQEGVPDREGAGVPVPGIGHRRLGGGDDQHAVVRRQGADRSEEHTSELQSLTNLVCRLLLYKNN